MMSASVAACCAAHPRSRGENLVHSSKTAVPQGSSPLTRGKLGCGFELGEIRGLIPAHAGKTETDEGIEIEARAHPRSRGENGKAEAVAKDAGGSSPLTRGKLHRELSAQVDDGLIPAHAGKTGCRFESCRRHTAHPRSRGENQDENIVNLSKQGSSPLTRGKRLAPVQYELITGLIPAHAGKTREHPVNQGALEAHPRSRGENRLPCCPCRASTGSSPLTRGKRDVNLRARGEVRLIPAHAGKTDKSHPTRA